MDLLSLIASGGGISAIVIFGVLGMALTVFVAGAALTLKANRSAHEARLALEDAEVKLAAAGDLANEVRDLRARFEETMLQHQDAVANARYQHNESCATQSDYAAREVRPEPRRDAPETDFKKHDDDHKKHHAVSSRKQDGDHKRRHGDDEEEPERRGFLGWFLDR